MAFNQIFYLLFTYLLMYTTANQRPKLT